MENLYQLERGRNPSETKSLLLKFIGNSGSTISETYLDDVRQVSCVDILGTEGEVLASGSGKGENHKIGAIAEALEHYFFWKRDRSDQTARPLGVIAEQIEFSEDYFLQEIFDEYKSADVGSEIFSRMDYKKDVLVPVGYVDPEISSIRSTLHDNAEDRIRRCSTNNGGALGTSLSESLLHGLNEAIERHYESILYQDLMGLKTQRRWHLYDYSRDRSLRNKLSKLKKNDKPPLLICTVTESGGYVAFCFYIGETEYSLAPIGAGSSLFAQLAAHRASDELAQTVAILGIGDESLSQEEQRASYVLSSKPRFRSLVQFSEVSVSSVLSRSNLKNNTGASEGLTPSKQINYIVENLVSSGFTPIYNILHQNESVYVTQVYVPQFDKFFVVRKGNLIAPIWAYVETEKSLKTSKPLNL